MTQKCPTFTLFVNGRFPMLMDFKGFRHVLTILARGYLFREDGSGYDRIDYARRALLAWCSLSGEKTKKAPDLDDPRRRVNYGEYAQEFPELVTPDGEGWLIRHVENIIAFVTAHPDAVRKGVLDKALALKKGFRGQWANKLRQMLVPAFASNLRVDLVCSLRTAPSAPFLTTAFQIVTNEPQS